LGLCGRREMACEAGAAPLVTPLEGELVDAGCSAVLWRPSEGHVEERLLRMLSREHELRARPELIEAVQRDGMRPVWRSKVASWLLEFEDEFGLSQDTIYVAVNYMDRYLSQVSTKRSLLQLLAMGAILVASKLHEACPLRMSDLRELADGTYAESDIKLMELELLRVIQWQLHPVTPQAVMSHLILYVADVATQHAVLEDAVTFLDVALPEPEFMKFAPSVQATAAVLCAFETSGLAGVNEWCARVRPYGVLASHCVLECKERMLAVFHSLCPSPPPAAAAAAAVAPHAVQPPSPVAPLHIQAVQPVKLGCRNSTPSPTGVDELMMSDEDELPERFGDPMIVDAPFQQQPLHAQARDNLVNKPRPTNLTSNSGGRAKPWAVAGPLM
jgi:hypothetical protein